jgi:hypothetical protein
MRDKPKHVAIKAMAAKLARLVYHMFRCGKNTWTGERNSTRPKTACDRSDSANGKPPSWDFTLLKLQPKTLDFLRIGFPGDLPGVTELRFRSETR